MRWAAILLVTSSAAMAAAPPGEDSRWHDWFSALQDTRGVGCCSIADCRAVDYRIAGDHYEVRFRNLYHESQLPEGWVVVPEDAVIPRPEGGPAGEIACWYGGRIRCFTQPPGV